jgi:hypothetical protein
MGHESQIEPWLAPDHRSALLVSQVTGFVANLAMKTAGKGTARQRVAFRAHGAEGKNNPAQLHGLEDKKTSGPRVRYFLLTFPSNRTLQACYFYQRRYGFWA